MRCATCGRLRLLDAFAGEGGAGRGYQQAGFCTDAVDEVPDRKTARGKAARLANYPTDCPAQRLIVTEAVAYLHEHGAEYAVRHTSPACTGYSRGTAALPDRLERYDRLIPVVRDVLTEIGGVYVIENVEDAKAELVDPVMLCWTEFYAPGSVLDSDGTPLQMQRHRMFESNVRLSGGGGCRHAENVQVAGSYGGARRNAWEAKHIRKGGYVPRSVDVQRALLGTPWMSEKGCQLSVPPAYTEHIGQQLLNHLVLSQRAA